MTRGVAARGARPHIRRDSSARARMRIENPVVRFLVNTTAAVAAAAAFALFAIWVVGS